MLMADTNMTDEWIERAIKANPCVLLESGNIRTCPVRLSFPFLFERSKPIPPATEGAFAANLIFPLNADLALLTKVAAEVTKAKWADAGTPKGPKLKGPLKKQDEMLKYEGYAEGGLYTTATSRKYQPIVIDPAQRTITDHERVYPGVWAICTLNAFTYDKGVNKGTSFGLQTVMIIADDKRLGGGGGGNIASDFAGVQIDAAVNPGAVFGDDPDAAALFS